MIERQVVQNWLNDYVRAWKSYDPTAIGLLFAENATYYYNPFDEPLRGREAIIASWLADPDTPNTFNAEYRVIAVDGNTAVANGRTTYTAVDGTSNARQYDNIFVIRFNDDGHCVDFTEWFMQPRA